MKNTRTLVLAAVSLAVGCIASAQNCTLNTPADAPPKVKELSAQVSASKACNVVPGITAKKLSVVWNAMLASSRTGGQRFETIPPAGLPTGKVFVSSRGVEFDLQSVAAEGVARLDVMAKGAMVASVANPTQTLLVVSANRLQPDTTYDWHLVTQKKSYKGSFETPSVAETQEVNAKLDAVTKAESEPKVQMVYQAVILDDAEFYVARDMVLKQLRTMSTP